MSKINSILGSDSVTVYVDGNSYTINRQAPTFEAVLNALRAQDLDALRQAVNIRQHIVDKLVKSAGSKVRIDDGAIFYEDREVTGLISTRVFEMLRLGLSVKPMVRFIENMMENPSKRAIDELFGFIDACRLPITDDGHFLAYKRVRSDYRDVHSGTMDNSVGKVLEMPRNMVDEDKNRTCSAGLHFCSYSYLAHFGGERIMVLKINPRDVVAIPADYNNSKGRTCRYEVVDEIEVYDDMPVKPIQDDYTNQYSSVSVWDEPEEAEEWEESWEESDDAEARIEDELDNLDTDELQEIDECFENGETVEGVASFYGISEDAADYLYQNYVRRVSSKPKDSNSGSKLTPNDVRRIRGLLNTGDYTLAEIAREYGVHPRSIARIRDGEAWSQID